MRKHNGMRPHDVSILLKIIALSDKGWLLNDLAASLKISISEISESLSRSRLAKLVDQKKKKINRENLIEFLEHGVKYVFPQEPGTLVKGVPTAHSHAFMKKVFKSELIYVWPDYNGKALGLSIEPFYSKQVIAIREDAKFYKLLALTDVIRVGRLREVEVAVKELKKIIIHEWN